MVALNAAVVAVSSVLVVAEHGATVVVIRNYLSYHFHLGCSSSVKIPLTVEVQQCMSVALAVKLT